MPFLGDQYGAALASGALRLRFDAAAGSFAIWAYDTHKLPVFPLHYDRILGTAGDFSAWMFNTTLIVAGFFVTTFTLYLRRDLDVLVERGVLVHRWAPRLISIAFVADCRGGSS